MSPLLLLRSSSSEQLSSPAARRGHGGKVRRPERSSGQFPQRSRRKTAVFGAVAQFCRLKLPPPPPLSLLFLSQLLRCAPRCSRRFSSSLLRSCPRNLAECKPGAGVSIPQPRPLWKLNQSVPGGTGPLSCAYQSQRASGRSNTHTHTRRGTWCMDNTLVLRMQQPGASIAALSFLSGAHSICRAWSCAKALLLAARLPSFMSPPPPDPEPKSDLLGSPRCTFTTAWRPSGSGH